MKPIQLTEKHKAKLLEMCKTLFPEYKRIEFEKSGMIILFKQILTPTKNYDYIHWFEFCMTHLAKKIIPKVTNYNLDSAYDSLYNVIYQFWETKHNHIVDYLYEEFKKLK